MLSAAITASQNARAIGLLDPITTEKVRQAAPRAWPLPPVPAHRFVREHPSDGQPVGKQQRMEGSVGELRGAQSEVVLAGAA